MSKFRSSVSEPYILRALRYASLFTCVLNVSVLIVCLSAGRWIFGDAMCQIFGFVSHVTVGGAAWLLALSGLERYYKLYFPAEHPCVFSDINTRLLITGIYILVAVIITNPLYGWGEFTEYRGYFHFTIAMAEGSSDTNLHQNYNIVGSNGSGGNYSAVQSCTRHDMQLDGVSVQNINLTDFVKVIESSLKEKWDIKARAWTIGPNLTYLLRARSEAVLQHFLRGYNASDISRTLLSSTYANCDCKTEGNYRCKEIYLNLTEIENYRRIFMAFQAPMMCSMDFTTVNKIADAWTAIFILSTAIMPCGAVVLLAGAILTQWRQLPLDVLGTDCTRTVKLLTGSILCVVLYTPYFVVNFLNDRGDYVSPMFHSACLVLYYSCFLVPSMVCWETDCSKTDDPSEHQRSEDAEDIEFELLQAGT